MSEFVALYVFYLDMDLSRYFAERGSWDETLGIFINSDGDPSQFSVCDFLWDLPPLN